MTALHRPIGIFDSGMGGVSVLGEAIRWMPTENYIYYGDSLNAPYGTKSKEAVIELSETICDFFMQQECKAIVIACNTATSAAAEHLRSKYPIPVIGIEPALKPAVEQLDQGDILVMATEMTLKEEKFKNLMDRTAQDRAVIKLACPSLVTLVEKGIIDGPEAEEAIRACFANLDLSRVTGVVLGCTHFVFLRQSVRAVLGDQVRVFDGNGGTVKHLLEVLEQLNLHDHEKHEATIQIINSAGMPLVMQSQKLLSLYNIEG